MHTLKSQLITDQDGEIIQIDAGFDGPKSDIEVYRDTKLKKEWLEKEKFGDKAYLGEDIETPKKKPLLTIFLEHPDFPAMRARSAARKTRFGGAFRSEF